MESRDNKRSAMNSQNCPPCIKSDGNKFPDRRDMQLKEAEKTIANKDVIIRMLQDHVKKLEESCKQNIKETENYRYKFCLAAEQMKRLRACQGPKEIKLLRSDSSAQNAQCKKLSTVQESCSAVPVKCDVIDQIKNIENFMKSHHELLQKIADKLPDKLTESKSNPNTQASFKSDEPMKLEEDPSVRDENGEFKVQAKDSLLNTYKRNNEELQRQLSSLLDTGEVETKEEDRTSEDLSPRRTISFGLVKTVEESEDKISEEQEKKIVTPIEEEREQESIDTISDVVGLKAPPSSREVVLPKDCTSVECGDLPAKNLSDEVTPLEECKCVDCGGLPAIGGVCGAGKTDEFAVHKAPETNETFDKKGSNERAHLTDTSSNTSEIFENSNLTEMLSKLNDLSEKVIQSLQKQMEASEEIRVLKSEITTSKSLTQECIQNFSQLTEVIKEENKTFAATFNEHKTTTQDIREINEKILQELAELRDKLQEITTIQSQNEQKVDSFSEDVVTVEELQNVFKRKRLEIDETAVSLAPMETPVLSEVVDEKNKTVEEDNDIRNRKISIEVTDEKNKTVDEDDMKNEKIKCINALLSFWKEARKNCLGVCPGKSAEFRKYVDEHLEQCACGNEELHRYIEKISGENLKLKTTISNIIEDLTQKLNELKGMQDKNTSTNTSHCVCEESAELTQNQNECHTRCKTEELEIEDIYKAVRLSVMPQSCSRFDSSSSCLCARIYTRPSHTAWSCQTIEDDPEGSFLCVCDNRCEFVPLSESFTVRSPYHSGKQELGPTCINGGDSDHCHGGQLISSLETYVKYLHEQLDVISHVEDQIEDLRLRIKTT